MTQIPDVSPELPPRTWRALLALVGRIPQGALSRSFGRLADLPIPRPLRPTLLGGFARSVGIDLSEAELPLREYPTLNEFFVRRLRPGARRWPDDPAVLASPVDGIAGQAGHVERGRLIQAKGRGYTAADLLADAREAERYEGGLFLTIYLSPRHYHRIHAPCGGAIPEARHVPGALFPVNAPAVAHIPDLFARNERLLCYIDGPLGHLALVAVGAYNVGRISAAFDPEWRGGGGAPAGAPAARGMRTWVTNRGGVQARVHAYEPPVPIEQGDEIMAFHMGSTVVLLLEPGLVLRRGLRAGTPVRLGEEIARAEA
jgi:phosphatidylserine decarboxylase